MKIDNTTNYTYNKQKVSFRSTPDTNNIIFSSQKNKSDFIEIKRDKKGFNFLQDIKDFIESLFEKDTITHSSSRRKKVRVLTESDVPFYDAKKISKLKKKNFENAMELLMLGLDTNVVQQSANLNDEEHKQAIELLERGITDKNLLHLARLKEPEFKDVIQLYDEGIDERSLVFYSQSGEYQKKETKNLLDKGETPQRAVILPKFTVDEENKSFFNNLMDNGFLQENAFQLAKNENLYKRINELIDEGIEESYILDIAKLPDNQRTKYEELKEMGIKYFDSLEIVELEDRDYKKVKKLIEEGTQPYYARAIYEIESGIIKNKKYDNFIKKGYGKNSAFSLSLMKEEEEKIIQKFLKEQPKIEKYFRNNFDVGYLKLQQEDTNELSFTKDYYINGTRIVRVDTINDKKELKQYRIENYQDGSTLTSIKKGRKSVLLKRDKDGSIISITEYLKNRSGATVGVLHSEKSNDLIGAMNTTFYDINDFICDDNIGNIDKDIKDSVKSKGTELSKVTKNEDGSIEYNENFIKRGFVTNRHYKKNAQNTEKEYSYIIKDITGKEILSISNYWKENADKTITNIISGNEYLITHNDKDKTITIEHKDKKRIINLNNKLAKYPKERLWAIAKKLDVDSLIEIDNKIKQWRYCSDTDSTYERNTDKLTTGENIDIISHEIGHIKRNSIIKNEDNFNKIKRSYIKEMKAFEANNTYDEQLFVEYFSTKADLSEVMGLEEFMAEANLIFNSYGNQSKDKSLKIRSQILVRNFPETLAKIAEYSNKNSKVPLI